MNDLYTIGYSPYTLHSFADVLKNNDINALADVRSSPYSKFKPEFNRESLKSFLETQNIAYVFLGDCCGARVDNHSYYVNGKVDYDLVAKDKDFNEGLTRIEEGLKKYRIALMCAEQDPITCHRTILICRNLRNIRIKHILAQGKIEDHADSEQRLLKLFRLNHPDMFISEKQRLSQAYSRQGKKIAYEDDETTGKIRGQENDKY
jgi:uncharacterized protein (DUF488 family)